MPAVSIRSWRSRNNMETTQVQVKHLVEVITREVLVALNEAEYRTSQPAGDYCSSECAEGICVDTCFNKVGEVVSAGASRLTSQLGKDP